VSLRNGEREPVELNWRVRASQHISAWTCWVAMSAVLQCW